MLMRNCNTQQPSHCRQHRTEKVKKRVWEEQIHIAPKANAELANIWTFHLSKFSASSSLHLERILTNIKKCIEGEGEEGKNTECTTQFVRYARDAIYAIVRRNLMIVQKGNYFKENAIFVNSSQKHIILESGSCDEVVQQQFRQDESGVTMDADELTQKPKSERCWTT